MHTSTQKPAVPEWLTEVCPAWCCGDHSGQDHPVDRVHFSDPVLVPVIERVRTVDRVGLEVVPVPTATEASLMLVQGVGDDDVWISISTETHLLEVSAESLRRLYRPLGELLHQMDSRD